MVVGVEVPVGRVTGVPGLRRPHAVAHLEIATERDDVGAPDRPTGGRVAAQRGSVDHEVRHARGGVPAFHAGRVAALGCPDPGRGVAPAGVRVGEALGEGERPQPLVEQRLERVRERTAEQFDRLGVDQFPQDGGTAVAPTGFEVRQSCRGRAVLARAELLVRGRRHPRGLVGADLPVAEPVVHPVEAVRVVELSREDRGDAERQHPRVPLGGEAAEHSGDGQVGSCPRLVQPLLAHRPAAVVGEPRQVRVQDQAEHARLARCHGFPLSRGHATGSLIAIATRSRLASMSASCSSKSSTPMSATSRVRSSGHGSPARARSIWRR